VPHGALAIYEQNLQTCLCAPWTRKLTWNELFLFGRIIAASRPRSLLKILCSSENGSGPKDCIKDCQRINLLAMLMRATQTFHVATSPHKISGRKSQQLSWKRLLCFQPAQRLSARLMHSGGRATRHATNPNSISWSERHGVAKSIWLSGFVQSRRLMSCATRNSQIRPSPMEPVQSSVDTGHNKATIAFGSNLGDRVGNIEAGLGEMQKRGLKMLKVSGLYETKPMYYEEQGAFLNGVCQVETDLPPLALLDVLQDIENALGRKRTISKGPRTLDLDIILFNHEHIRHERLDVPHKLMLEREFVLRPLAE